MQSVLSFLRARLAERTSRVQLAVLVVTGAVAAGLVSTDQVAAYATTAMTVLTLIGPLAGILTPDTKAEVPVEAVANAALAAAEAAAAKVPGAELVRRDVEQVAAAAEQAFADALSAKLGG